MSELQKLCVVSEGGWMERIVMVVMKGRLVNRVQWDGEILYNKIVGGIYCSTISPRAFI